MNYINSVKDMNTIFDNENNIYYGHGTAIPKEDIENSIFRIGLRCPSGFMSSTTLPINLGKDFTDSNLNMIENWEHRGSDKVVIVSLPFRKYDFITNNIDELSFAYCYYPEGKKGIDKSQYVMPQFVKGYYDKTTKQYIENPSYYEHLSKVEQEELFSEVRKNLYSCVKEKHEITSKNYTGKKFGPQPSMTIIEYIRFLEKNNFENPFTTEEVGIDWALEVWDRLSEKNYGDKKAKLPNGIEISVHQYLTEYISQFIPPNGKFELKNGSIITAQQFIEDYILSPLGQDKYNGNIENLLADYVVDNNIISTHKNKDTKDSISKVIKQEDSIGYAEVYEPENVVLHYEYGLTEKSSNEKLNASLNDLFLSFGIYDVKRSKEEQEIIKNEFGEVLGNINTEQDKGFTYNQISENLKLGGGISDFSDYANVVKRINIEQKKIEEVRINEISELLNQYQNYDQFEKELLAMLTKNPDLVYNLKFRNLAEAIHDNKKELKNVNNSLQEEDLSYNLKKAYNYVVKLSDNIQYNMNHNVSIDEEDITTLQMAVDLLEDELLKSKAIISTGETNKIVDCIEQKRKFIKNFNNLVSDNHFKMGFAKVWMLGLITTLVSVGIIVLGIILTK